jgi:hypothetical protein
MEYRKIIQRPDKSYVQIQVHIYNDRHTGITYDIQVSTKQPRKRTWVYLDSDKILNHVSELEILEAKTEYWKSIKPLS